MSTADGSTPAAPDAVVVVGGDLAAGSAGPVVAAVAGCGPETIVIAADSGLALAVAQGLTVHHVVGDLDSVAPDLVADAAAGGATVHRHPADKDATDSELALDLAVHLIVGVVGGRLGTTIGRRPHLVVLGGGGGRLDHLLADLASLCAPRLADLEVSGRFGAASVEVVRPGRPRPVGGQKGEYLSLLALQGTVRGVTTEGLRWPLVDAVLDPGTTRGVSNEVLDPAATVAIADGVLLVVRPGQVAGVVAPRATPYDPTPGRR